MVIATQNSNFCFDVHPINLLLNIVSLSDWLPQIASMLVICLSRLVKFRGLQGFPKYDKPLIMLLETMSTSILSVVTCEEFFSYFFNFLQVPCYFIMQTKQPTQTKGTNMEGGRRGLLVIAASIAKSIHIVSSLWSTMS